MRKFLKKIHLYLGLFSAIVLIFLGLTGAILSYEKKLLEVINPRIYNINSENKESIDKAMVLEKLQKENNLIIQAIRMSDDNNKSIGLVTLPAEDSNSERKVLLFVNPYTEEINEQFGRWFFIYARYIHLDLLLGKTVGKNLVAISTIILIILSISGIYLYSKPLLYNIRSAMKIDFKQSGKKFYYKLHSVLGIYFSLAFLVMALSGLFWSYEWYKKGVYSIAGIEMPKGRFQVTNSSDENENPKEKQTREKAPVISLDIQKTFKAIEFFDNYVKSNYKEFTIRKVRNSEAFQVTYLKKDYQHSKAINTLQFNVDTKTIIFEENYDDIKTGQKFINSMLPIHSGEFFGTFFQIFFLIASISLMIFAITGFLLFKKTRIKNEQK
ncbi:PepSY-associated TM helix domain-containing protein [Aliarcobacter butzleri]|uniref:PepSY-associated TM helix domain-containing protein n=1 Tax=Aliarcobacter butzleri TaxID=28197 RepID=UPI00263E81E6|nr:PepSY-associated TM helix domain-containing protein [Aliarcobacter butzleri]MDN5043291.1 PepSY-associated TM helix domain-containing protein [Aliarcobacter butzleri]